MLSWESSLEGVREGRRTGPEDARDAVVDRRIVAAAAAAAARRAAAGSLRIVRLALAFSSTARIMLVYEAN